MEKSGDLLLLKEKKKKRKAPNASKKRRHSTTPQNSEDTEKSQTRSSPRKASSLPPLPTPPQGHAARDQPPHRASSLPPLPTPPQGHAARDQPPRRAKAGSRDDGESGGGTRGGRTKKPLKTPSKQGTAKSGITSGAPSQGDVAELSAQTRGSLRWEGVLEDPLAEAKRLEVYRADRRQRYLAAHRRALVEDAQEGPI